MRGSGTINNKKGGNVLAIYSFGHFLVDLSCAFLMSSLALSDGDIMPSVILYNFCAFAMQMPIGLLADRLDRNSAVASAGMGFVLLAFFLAPIPLLCSVILGLGNCLYHVGGGIDVLDLCHKKQWMLGVFVSPGAMGLFVGTLLAKGNVLSLPLGGAVIFALFLAVSVGLGFTYPLIKPSGNVKVSLVSSGRAPILAALCLFMVVVLRSYVGMTLYTPWKNGALLSFLSVLGLVLGKCAGGFLADRFGALNTAVTSLALCSVLFMFSENAVCGLLAIFLFNMTMPITLFAMAKLFGGARGFAFGILTFALFLGCIPNFLMLSVPFYGKVWFHALEAVLSLLLLAAGLIFGRERGEK